MGANCSDFYKTKTLQKAVPLPPKMAVLEFTECINVQFNF